MPNTPKIVELWSKQARELNENEYEISKLQTARLGLPSERRQMNALLAKRKRLTEKYFKSYEQANKIDPYKYPKR